MTWPLPEGLPDSLTLSELRQTMQAMGYDLALTQRPAPPQPQPMGFAPGHGQAPQRKAPKRKAPPLPPTAPLRLEGAAFE